MQTNDGRVSVAAKMTPNIGTGGSAGKGGALVGGTIGWNNTVQRQRKL